MNIIFNKTESFVGRNTSDHTCQILCSKSNCGNIYVSLIFPPRDNRGKKKKKRMFAPPTAIYTHGPGLMKVIPETRCAQ